jgi:hypothetical protein
MKRGETQTVHGLSRALVRERVGSLSQVARLDSFTVDDGPARGTRRIRMVNGGGLDLEILPDRSMDLGHVSFKGTPLAWISPVGMQSPYSYSEQGTEWLRSFGGGLLATCGLDTYGPESQHDGVHFPMHGRVGAIPARITETLVGETELRVSGEVRQAKVFSENLVLTRTLSSTIGGSSLTIEDTVTNESAHPSPHMMLYHFNLGWPLLDETATLHIPSTLTTPRDDEAKAGFDHWSSIGTPELGYREQVFVHEFDEGLVTVGIENPNLGIRLDIGFDSKQLPALFQWKMADHGHYVMGLEPANVAQVQGLAAAAKQGQLPLLQPGEAVSYAITLNVSEVSN